MEDIRRGGGGSSSNKYDLGSGVSFKLSELGVAPSLEGAAPGWEPAQTDAFRATAGPSLVVHRRLETALDRITHKRALLEPAQLRLCEALAIECKPTMRPVTSTGSGAPADAATAAMSDTPDTVGTHHAYGRLNPSQREAYLAATDPG